MEIDETVNKSWFQKLCISVVFGAIAFILSLEAPQVNIRWWHRLIQFGWFVSFGYVMSLIFGDWVEREFGKDALGGFIGACCFLQKPFRILLRSVFDKVSTDPIEALRKITDIWRRK